MKTNRYQAGKEAAREEAITWLNAEFYEPGELGLSYSELSGAAEHFYKLGKRYGLLREFKENAII